MKLKHIPILGSLLCLLFQPQVCKTNPLNGALLTVSQKLNVRHEKLLACFNDSGEISTYISGKIETILLTDTYHKYDILTNLADYIGTGFIYKLVTCKEAGLAPAASQPLSLFVTEYHKNFSMVLVQSIVNLVKQTPEVMKLFGELLNAYDFHDLSLVGSKFVEIILLSRVESNGDPIAILTGLFRGFANSLETPDFCVSSLEALPSIAAKILQKLVSSCFVEKATGMKELQKFFNQDIPSATQVCRESLSDKDKARLIVLSQKVTDLPELGRLLAINHRLHKDEYDALVTHSIQYSSEKRYYDSGFEAGKALALISLTPETPELAFNAFESNAHLHPLTHKILPATSQRITMSPKELKVLTKSFILGFLRVEHEIDNCFVFMKEESDSVQSIVHFFNKSTLRDTLYALKLLADFVEFEFATWVKSCQPLVEAVQKLIRLSGSIRNPASFVFQIATRITINRAEIFENVTKIRESFPSRDYKTIGYSMGAIFSKMLLNEKSGLEPIPEISVPLTIKRKLSAASLTVEKKSTEEENENAKGEKGNKMSIGTYLLYCSFIGALVGVVMLGVMTVVNRSKARRRDIHNAELLPQN